MSKYYKAIRRSAPGETTGEDSAPNRERVAAGDIIAIRGSTPAVTIAQGVPDAVALESGIQRLSERLAPLAVFDDPVRLLISGCRPGDGASTIAVALAIDLSQRLSLRTILVDAHLRHPSLHRVLARNNGRGSGELVTAGHVQMRSTGWPRLDLATCWLAGDGANGRELLDEFGSLAAGYPAVVVDLGVARLDARMLPMARPQDPILLVVRYGHTERHELATTASALRAANRTVGGVILNAISDPVAKSIRRLVSQ